MLIKIISFFSYSLFLFELKNKIKFHMLWLEHSPSLLEQFHYFLLFPLPNLSRIDVMHDIPLTHASNFQIMFQFSQSFVAYIQSLNVNTNPKTWTWLHPNCFLQWHSHKYIQCWLILNYKLFLQHICETTCWNSTQKWRFWKNLTKFCLIFYTKLPKFGHNH